MNLYNMYKAQRQCPDASVASAHESCSDLGRSFQKKTQFKSTNTRWVEPTLHNKHCLCVGEETLHGRQNVNSVEPRSNQEQSKKQRELPLVGCKLVEMGAPLCNEVAESHTHG